MNGQSKKSHPSYGMVGVSRVQSQGTRLFGSSIEHHNTIVLRVKTASAERNLNRTWYHGSESIVEVEMSAIQYADMISTPNVGDGVPCTIRYRADAGQIARCPAEHEREVFSKEFAKDVRDATDLSGKIVARAKQLLSGKQMKASERDELIEMLEKLDREVRANMPFVHKQFNEEAFVQHKILSLGIESLRKQVESAAPEIPMLSPAESG